MNQAAGSRDGAGVAPIAMISQSAPIHFQTKRGGGTYMDLNKSMLEVKVKRTTPTGGDIVGTVHVSAGNLSLQWLFQSVPMKIPINVLS